MKKLTREFYNRDTLKVASELIGKILVREYGGDILSARIVETEAYIGAIDKASHCYKGETDRTKVMFGPPGYAYVYLIYGMYYCFNVVTEGEGCGSGVLIRGIEPIENIEIMSFNRYGKRLKDITKQQLKNISNGPGKLCKALNISKNENKLDLTKDELYIIDDGFKDFNLERSKRINIDYAEEAKDFLWRFTMNRL
ncbi:DNA-3-methyladenine glycosylase [Sedimentibacter acidaminivorans]|uniref:Putative 3-methyladenine DNA glycosylase n=1 Tax=Sedimentibacter acidaminivorans TaxID=913099 RepID=A0ABS4GE64_9FIRM|nr:DNA-3-methyladenine glycosylase [Sedimentibacter acidaminivorans]MBP1925937.1 DNA-3-methyladenine glycosylase [Sedimentibacter acidaminivorans]